MKWLWKVLVTPSCWRLNYPVSGSWDAALNEMLDNPYFTKIEDCTVTLDGLDIWVKNFPYAYGAPYPDRQDIHFLPRR